jgi:hypothetical protein
MTTKSIALKSIIGTTLLATSIAATAANVNFKVAVIEDAPKSQAIIAGDYESAIASLSKQKISNSSFEEQTSLCVAYIKSETSLASESVCTAAITSAKKLNATSSKVRYLRSISYNNRAISRYHNNDIAGAMNDLVTAYKIDNNPITKTNLTLIKASITPMEEESVSAE